MIALEFLVRLGWAALLVALLTSDASWLLGLGWCALCAYLLWDLVANDLPAMRQAWRELQEFKREKE